ncbi:hypothetical protein CR159_01060 [Pollutimonas subterranea]|uniref:DUF2380 domain-containing protein n=2 Tax=Pollutimonas subterranea TaxID=2045210 RepID=A0A2N4U9J2_9BURK|nr:hypothetical protein CR159_01060 [Pollutimonas subterranea]
MPVSLNSGLATLLLRGRQCLAALVILAPFAVWAAESPVQSIAIMDFELIDNTGETGKDAEQKLRLTKITEQLRHDIADKQLYTVVDNAPAATLIKDLQKRFNLHSCNGCDVEIGRALHTNRVLTGWVQKVSNLILNINIQVRDVEGGKIVLNKSVDIRGNTDQTWSRGIRYMVRSMVEKNQAGL